MQTAPSGRSVAKLDYAGDSLFVDYGPDYHRETPLYDATIVLGRHARKLFSGLGCVEQPQAASMRAFNVSASQCFSLPSLAPTRKPFLLLFAADAVSSRT